MVAGLCALALAAGAATAPLAPGEGRLDIVAWNGYVERGATDPRYDWVTPFERSTGCKVHAQAVASTDEMLARMRKGGVDLATVSGHGSHRLIIARLVQPLDLARVPGYRTRIDRRLQDSPTHYVNGQHYGVPFVWAPRILLYDKRVFPGRPPELQALFEPMLLPDGKPNRGRLQARDSPIIIAEAALYLMQRRPELGIRDPYELNEAQYRAALDALRGQFALVHSVLDDANRQVEDFRAGRVALALTWSYPALALKRSGAPVGYVVPPAGSTGWSDATMLHVNAPHPNCAYRWLEWSTQPEVQGDVAAFTGTVPSVPAACKASKLLGPKGCEERGAAHLDRIHFIKTPTARCPTHGKCVGYARWQADYAALRAARPH